MPAAELLVQLLQEVRGLAGTDVFGDAVQLLHHAPHRAVEQQPLVHRLDVALVDQPQRLGEGVGQPRSPRRPGFLVAEGRGNRHEDQDVQVLTGHRGLPGERLFCMVAGYKSIVTDGSHEQMLDFDRRLAHPHVSRHLAEEVRKIRDAAVQ
jgi:hypothetical protein